MLFSPGRLLPVPAPRRATQQRGARGGSAAPAAAAAAAPAAAAAGAAARQRRQHPAPPPHKQHVPRSSSWLLAAPRQARRTLHAAGATSSSASASSQQQQQQQPQQDDELVAAEWEEDEDEGEWGEWEEDDEFEEDEGDEGEGAAAAAAPRGRVIPADAATTQFAPDDFVEVGMITRPHGVRGEVKVRVITDEPRKRLGTPGRRLWLQPPPGAAAGGQAPPALLQRVRVQSGRVSKPGGGQREEWAVKFQEVADRDQAATLGGHKLLLALCDREAAPAGRDEYFIDQLVGLRALHAGSGALLGLVTEVYDSGSSYSLLRLRLAPEEQDIAASRYRSLLVPFVAEMVPCVDVAGGSLSLSLPDGLAETASSRDLPRPYTAAQQAQLRQQLARRQAQHAAWEREQQGNVTK